AAGPARRERRDEHPAEAEEHELRQHLFEHHERAAGLQYGTRHPVERPGRPGERERLPTDDAERAEPPRAEAEHLPGPQLPPRPGRPGGTPRTARPAPRRRGPCGTPGTGSGSGRAAATARTRAGGRRRRGTGRRPRPRSRPPEPRPSPAARTPATRACRTPTRAPGPARRTRRTFGPGRTVGRTRRPPRTPRTPA